MRCSTRTCRRPARCRATNHSWTAGTRTRRTCPLTSADVPGPASGVPRPAQVAPRRLAALAALVGGRVDEADAATEVAGVTSGTAFVRPGDLFAALPGRSAHGASFAGEARAAGAVALLTDAAGRELAGSALPVVEVADVRAALGPVSAEVYGRPSEHLRVLGVTGTSGKTTTTFLVRAGLLAAGRTPGLIGTVATMIGDDEIPTGFTTPEAPELQALLAVMRERGVTDVAVEVSSHALAMGRVDGIDFAVGAFTNLSEDHLDFHRDMDDYFAAKASLFRRTRRGVTMLDDVWGRRLAAADADLVTVSTTGVADWTAFDVHAHPAGATAFRVRGPRGEFETECTIPGRYNVANALLALVLLAETGIDPAGVADAVGHAAVPGRMERVDAGQPFLAVVDYSHKPAAVEGALKALRPLTEGRLIVVLGCGGDRDRGKRPHMGEIAARGAELLIVTDDNPRSEDPAAIRAAMVAGALAVPESQRGEVREVGDRRAAILEAVEAARPGDTVLVAGKGHETGQEVAGVVHPFDDREVLREALREVPR
ncbi:MAG: UDP-N-acetylmuramoyl-L-alanyl-D-glutamate--2,6-diaminopimelate ligase [Jatrophihabitans sp.]|uniref:UDP-N-acetylmuramoyl-L-alanyl-D-glutamate--2, 6-diaminopimelate ligase n=1 Tax=Jatrophihabitans sp. TaxID=1932789 RepID=UPI003F8126FB